MKTRKNAAEAKLASLAWKFTLIETSVKVTRTPGTTLKSLLLDLVKEEVTAHVAELGRGLRAVNTALGDHDLLGRTH